MHRILARLVGIQKSTSYHSSLFLQNLEKDLQEKYDHLLLVEKEFWKTKSRISWICDGDANTRFFHTSNLTRRRRNRITYLETKFKETLDSLEAIPKHTFQSLNSTEQISIPWDHSGGSALADFQMNLSRTSKLF